MACNVKVFSIVLLAYSYIIYFMYKISFIERYLHSHRMNGQFQLKSFTFSLEKPLQIQILAFLFWFWLELSRAHLVFLELTPFPV